MDDGASSDSARSGPDQDEMVTDISAATSKSTSTSRWRRSDKRFDGKKQPMDLAVAGVGSDMLVRRSYWPVVVREAPALFGGFGVCRV